MTGIREIWNSPVVGAYLLWRFVDAYQETCKHGPNIALAFPAINMLMQPQFTDDITPSMRSLASYAKKLSENNKRGYLTDLQSDIRIHKDRILEIIETAVVVELVGVNYEDGTLTTLISEEPAGKRIAEAFKNDLGLKAAALGRRFAKEPLENICNILGVYFK